MICLPRLSRSLKSPNMQRGSLGKAVCMKLYAALKIIIKQFPALLFSCSSKITGSLFSCDCLFFSSDSWFFGFFSSWFMTVLPLWFPFSFCGGDLWRNLVRGYERKKVLLDFAWLDHWRTWTVPLMEKKQLTKQQTQTNWLMSLQQRGLH